MLVIGGEINRILHAFDEGLLYTTEQLEAKIHERQRVVVIDPPGRVSAIVVTNFVASFFHRHPGFHPKLDAIAS